MRKILIKLIENLDFLEDSHKDSKYIKEKINETKKFEGEYIMFGRFGIKVPSKFFRGPLEYKEIELQDCIDFWNDIHYHNVEGKPFYLSRIMPGVIKVSSFIY